MKTGFLSEIVSHKRSVALRDKKNCSLAQVKKQSLVAPPALKLSEAILRGSGIIAEIKRRSPGGVFNVSDISALAKEYQKNGASAISVLTDEKFFGGSINDIVAVKKCVDIPVLRKDFILNEYHVCQSRACGADAILLIASILDKKKLARLLMLTDKLGMEALIETHSMKELRRVLDLYGDGLPVRIAGINNRNLSTLKIDLKISRDLLAQIPDEIVSVVESGIDSREQIQEFRKLGAKGFLIGTALLKAKSPGEKLQSLSHH
ncbi:MAG: indole-3-glycerol-phosphate synthase [Planctomycetes bacterium]|nr:indole-3-glycerol-phosphate synthase [Planctomycetota bacterium]